MSFSTVFPLSFFIEGNIPAMAELSITDPCLGWEASEKLLYELAEY